MSGWLATKWRYSKRMKSMHLFSDCLSILWPYTSSDDVTCIYSETVRELKPMTSQLTTLHSSCKVRGAIVTVKGSSTSTSAADAAYNNRYDFGSRYFAPWVGINEDPVTGRCHDSNERAEIAGWHPYTLYKKQYRHCDKSWPIRRANPNKSFAACADAECEGATCFLEGEAVAPL